MTGKEKFDYWAKIIFFIIFALASGAAAIYTLLTYPFGVLTLLYFFGMGAGCAFSIWAATGLIKEYRKKRK